jgi:aminoglycoside 3'-phosphotransferase-2
MNREDEVSALLRADGGDMTGVRIELVTGGMSGAGVFRIIQRDRATRYVKFAEGDAAAVLREEVTRTSWLAAQGITVPRILRVNDQATYYAVLMDAAHGTPADASPLPVPQLVTALARALIELHALPSITCPFDETLAVRLACAAKAIAAGEVDPEEFEPRNKDLTPEFLLARLSAVRLTEDIVVVHGDATLSNLMIAPDGGVSFIDCGNAGRGDRYLDLALLASDIEGHYGEKAAHVFIAAYGERSWSKAKSRYYLDLYELF